MTILFLISTFSNTFSIRLNLMFLTLTPIKSNSYTYLACSLPTANFNLERDFKIHDLILNIIVFSDSNSLGFYVSSFCPFSKNLGISYYW